MVLSGTRNPGIRLFYLGTVVILCMLQGACHCSPLIPEPEKSKSDLLAFEKMLKGHHEPLPSAFETLIKEMEWHENSEGHGKRRRMQVKGPLRHWKEVRDEAVKIELDSIKKNAAKDFPDPDGIKWGELMEGFEPSESSDTTSKQLRGKRSESSDVEAVRRKLVGNNVKQLGMQPPALNSGPTVASLNASLYRWDSLRVQPPDWVDWRTTAASTLVKDQRKCSSCWALVVADAVSIMWQIRKGKGLQPLPDYKENIRKDPQFTKQGKLDGSVQQICDCMVGDCCSGGWPEWALSYVAANGGLTLWKDYPYYAQKTTCDYGQSQDIKIKMTGWESVPPGDTLALKAATAQASVIVFISASSSDFQTYNGGFYDGDCGTELDHVVLVVGYGTDATYGPYWIIKNTWGTIWGDEGYMYIKAEADGKGKCGMTSVEGLYPTFFKSNEDPCSGNINPCGTGTCFSQKIGNNKVARCGCPPGTVENTQSFPAKCVRADPCSANPNPCGEGTCANLADGSYECSCPAGTIVGAAANGASTCVSGNKVGGVRTYMINNGDTCQTVTSSYSLPLDIFSQLNGWVDCSNPNSPLPAGAVVAIGSDDLLVGCSRNYIVQPADTCQSIAAAAGIDLATLVAQNPALRCDLLSPGAEICIVPGGSAKPTQASATTCATPYVVVSGDSCTSIVQSTGVNDVVFSTLNPSVDCGQPLTPGTSVCLQAQATVPAINCTSWYRVQHGDKCPKIWLAANLTGAQFSYLNPGIKCEFPNLQVGQLVCLAAPGSTPAFTATIPYTVQSGDTLVAISAKLADRCGSDASPDNIASQNFLLSTLLFLVPGTVLQVPCTARTTRTCGCSPGDWYCGDDGSWYSSYCDVVCNGALPAASYCSSCNAACKARAGLPPAWGGCENPCPWPQWNPLPSNWWWFTSDPCTYYVKACQDWCSDSASTACILQGNWDYWGRNYNNCVYACRRGKC